MKADLFFFCVLQRLTLVWLGTRDVTNGLRHDWPGFVLSHTSREVRVKDRPPGHLWLPPVSLNVLKPIDY